MTKAELGTIIARVFALILFLNGIKLIVVVPYLFTGESYMAVSYGANIVIHLGLAAYFWLNAQKIGKNIIATSPKKEVALPAYDQGMHLVFIGFGLWILTKTIPDISNILAYVMSDGMIEGRKISGFNYWEPGLRIALYAALGLLLILGTEGLRKTLLGLRKAGVSK